MRRLVVGTFAGMFVAGLAVAQMPAHATVLNTPVSLNNPLIAQYDDTVHLFASMSTSPTLVLHWRSEDGGRTWPVAMQPLTATFGPFVLEKVDASATRLLVLVTSATAGPLLFRSTDRGNTWSVHGGIASVVAPQTTPFRADMYVNGSVVVVAWTNDRPTGRIFCNRSADGGVTWQPTDTQLDVGPPVPLSAAVPPLRCVGAGSVVHVLWNGAASTSVATFHQRSLDGGLTWRPTPVYVSVHSTERAVTDGANVLVVDTLGPPLRSANFGDTWAAATGTAVQRSLDLASDGALVLATGSATSPSTVPSTNYVVDISQNGGQTWLTTPLLVPYGWPASLRASIGGGCVWAHVLSSLGTNPNFGVIVSPDGGATWQVLAGPVEGGFHAGDRRTIHLGVTSAQAVVRHYVYVGTGSSTLGTPTTGTGNVAPKLTTVGLPLQGRSTTLQLERAVGGSVGALGVSFAPPAPTPLGSATIWLGGAPILFGFATSGASGAPGAGSFGLPVAVPVAPTLVGASFSAQALVVDAGAADGFTVTNAIEVWLR